VVCAALFFTFSRAAWAGLILGLVFLLFILIIKKDKAGQLVVLKTIAVGSVLIFILFSLYSDLVLTRLSQDTRLEAKSNTERIESFASAREIIKDNWLLGVGIGNYTQELEKLNPGQEIWAYQPTHNTFLLAWAEIGIVGLTLFLLIILSIIKLGFRNCLKIGNWKLEIGNKDKTLKQSNGEGLVLIAIILPIAMVDHWLWSLHFGILLFWLILGLSYKIINNKPLDVRHLKI